MGAAKDQLTALLDLMGPCAHCHSSEVDLIEATPPEEIEALDVSPEIAEAVMSGFGTCNACGASGPVAPTTAEAVEAWNRRISPIAMQGDVPLLMHYHYVGSRLVVDRVVANPPLCLAKVDQAGEITITEVLG
jgi:hypothetical protein